MAECDTTFSDGTCPGTHLGKFSSCLDEALWDFALEDSRSYAGDPDYGYASLVIAGDGPGTSEEYVWNPNAGRGRLAVTVPGGWYIVYTGTSGAVSTAYYDSEERANDVFTAWHDAFRVWADDAA